MSICTLLYYIVGCYNDQLRKCEYPRCWGYIVHFFSPIVFDPRDEFTIVSTPYISASRLFLFLYLIPALPAFSASSIVLSPLFIVSHKGVFVTSSSQLRSCELRLLYHRFFKETSSRARHEELNIVILKFAISYQEN